jgi:hypothetical protein
MMTVQWAATAGRNEHDRRHNDECKHQGKAATPAVVLKVSGLPDERLGLALIDRGGPGSSERHRKSSMIWISS